MQLIKLLSILSFTVHSFSAFAVPVEKTTPTVFEICAQPQETDGVGQLRAKYVCEIESYLPLVKAALADTDAPVQEQAQILNQLRREIGLKYKKLTPQWLRSLIYCRNQKVYKDPLGPTYEALIAKGKQDSDIASSATRTGGRDFLLDNRIAVAMIDFVNYMNWGWLIESLWSRMPGDACPLID